MPSITISQEPGNFRYAITDGDWKFILAGKKLPIVNGRTTPEAKQANDTGYWKDLQWMDKSDFK